MREEIIIAGFGGQGVMFLGKLICQAALYEKRHVSWLPSYGAEMRGGTAHCAVVISDSPIASPFVAQADTCIVLNQPSLNKFIGKVKQGGLLLVNSSLAEDIPSREGIKINSIPLSNIAANIGDEKVANLVGLGVWLQEKHIVAEGSIMRALKERCAGKQAMLALNESALRAGEKSQERYHG